MFGIKINYKVNNSTQFQFKLSKKNLGFSSSKRFLRALHKKPNFLSKREKEMRLVDGLFCENVSGLRLSSLQKNQLKGFLSATSLSYFILTTD